VKNVLVPLMMEVYAVITAHFGSIILVLSWGKRSSSTISITQILHGFVLLAKVSYV
jgi:hypothetical protein